MVLASATNLSNLGFTFSGPKFDRLNRFLFHIFACIAKQRMPRTSEE